MLSDCVQDLLLAEAVSCRFSLVRSAPFDGYLVPTYEEVQRGALLLSASFFINDTAPSTFPDDD
jgi:hypothetical protein